MGVFVNYIIIFSCVFFSLISFPSWKVKRIYHTKTKKSKILSITPAKNFVKAKKILKDFPMNLAEGKVENSKVFYQEILLPTSKISRTQYNKFKKSLKSFRKKTVRQSEIKTIIKQGPDKNRIVLTILGDGYTHKEKDKFFKDVKRITKDLFVEKTFSSYLSLFNIYAVFLPSNESGISDMSSKDTVFGLYRSPAGSKRGIIPGNRAAIERALDLAPAPADYPVIIANDDFYGGLGGQYAITTRSLTSGSMVLRHELGHNFGNVGEEYDGGQVYSGANFTSKRSKKLKWNHWINGEFKLYKAEFLGGDYIWQPLKNRSYKKTYRFPKDKKDLLLKISSVGWSSNKDVKVKINGREVEYKGLFTKDRSFFNYLERNIKSEEISIEIIDSDGDGDDVLAFINVYAFPENYNYSPDLVQGFANYNQSGNFVGYRPTHNSCLMRNMRTKDFCAVDIENMWHEFFKRIKLIDSLEIKDSGKVTIHTPDLNLLVKWYKGDVELTEFRNSKNITLKEKGNYKVKVVFKTKEVRNPDEKFIQVKKFSW